MSTVASIFTLVSSEQLLWIGLTCFFCALACSQVGTFLVMRRLSLVGDAISHSVLPGIVIGFLFAKSLDSPWLLVGAGLSGMLATVMIELIHNHSRIKQDAAIGISFTTLFALGVLLLKIYADKVDLDPDCVIYGQVEYVWNYERVDVFGISMPRPTRTLGFVAMASVAIVAVLYRVLLVSSFDASLSTSFGYRPVLVHYTLMGLTSFVVVAAFQVVGAILVIALLILPGATGYLCANRLRTVLVLAAGHALFSSILGLLIALRWNINTGAAVVLAGGGLFGLAWLFAPVDGVVVKMVRRRQNTKTLELEG
jgi:manganese/zinc/iron transport system permease protein